MCSEPHSSLLLTAASDVSLCLACGCLGERCPPNHHIFDGVCVPTSPAEAKPRPGSELNATRTGYLLHGRISD